MDGVLLEDCFKEMDKKFVSEGRKAALVIDTCSTHPQIENVKQIKLFFIPSNTSSQTQPMDQTAICSLKA